MTDRDRVIAEMNDHKHREPVYFVWNPSTCYTRHQHDSIHSARNEAQRLARLHPGQEFWVLEARASFKKHDIEEHLFYSEIPF